jgi:hypothetical protein
MRTPSRERQWCCVEKQLIAHTDFVIFEYDSPTGIGVVTEGSTSAPPIDSHSSRVDNPRYEVQPLIRGLPWARNDVGAW